MRKGQRDKTKKYRRVTQNSRKFQAISLGQARGKLRGGEVMPDFAGGLHLEDSTLIRVEEVSATGNAMVGGGAHGAARPVGWTDSAAVLFDLGHEVDSVFHAVLDTRRPGGY
jgi:hypothetical protein